MRPTDEQRDEDLRQYLKVLEAHTEEEILLHRFRHWRDLTLFNFTDCPHTEQQLIAVSNEHGQWMVQVCVECGQQRARMCPHVKRTWHLDAVLTCDNCGVNCT